MTFTFRPDDAIRIDWDGKADWSHPFAYVTDDLRSYQLRFGTAVQSSLSQARFVGASGVLLLDNSRNRYSPESANTDIESGFLTVPRRIEFIRWDVAGGVRVARRLWIGVAIPQVGKQLTYSNVAPFTLVSGSAGSAFVRPNQNAFYDQPVNYWKDVDGGSTSDWVEEWLTLRQFPREAPPAARGGVPHAAPLVNSDQNTGFVQHRGSCLSMIQTIADHVLGFALEDEHGRVVVVSADAAAGQEPAAVLDAKTTPIEAGAQYRLSGEWVRNRELAVSRAPFVQPEETVIHSQSLEITPGGTADVSYVFDPQFPTVAVTWTALEVVYQNRDGNPAGVASNISITTPVDPDTGRRRFVYSATLTSPSTAVADEPWLVRWKGRLHVVEVSGSRAGQLAAAKAGEDPKFAPGTSPGFWGFIDLCTPAWWPDPDDSANKATFARLDGYLSRRSRPAVLTRNTYPRVGVSEAAVHQIDAAQPGRVVRSHVATPDGDEVVSAGLVLAVEYRKDFRQVPKKTVWTIELTPAEAPEPACVYGTTKLDESGSARGASLPGIAIGNTGGAWSDGTTLLVVDTSGHVRGYVADGDGVLAAADTAKTFALHADNAKPWGIWSDGTTVWVTDTEDNKAYAYTAAGSRDSGKDVGFTVGAAPTGLTGTADAFYVSATRTMGRNRELLIVRVDRSDPTTQTVAVSGGDYLSGGATDLTVTEDGSLLRVDREGVSVWSASAPHARQRNRQAPVPFNNTAGAATSDAGTLLMLDSFDGVHEVCLDSPPNPPWGNRDAAKDVVYPTAEAPNQARSWGVWSDGTTIWVAHTQRSGISSKWPNLYAYTLATGARDSGKDIALPQTYAGASVFGVYIWSDGTTMWVFPNQANQGAKLYAYTLATGARDSAKDITLAGIDPTGGARDIWSDGTTLWANTFVTDTPGTGTPGQYLYAFVLSTGARDSGKDITFPLSQTSARPTAFWVDGDLILGAAMGGVRTWRKGTHGSESLGSNDYLPAVGYGTSPDDYTRAGSDVYTDGTTLWVATQHKLYAYTR